MKYQIIQGDNRETLKTIADNSIDAIVTDPPYGIDFLGKAWDANTGALETYQECLRVLKPGGHILAFSAPRTYHHLAITLEQAGFEIRDQIMWIYSSGFPKSQDVGKSIDRLAGKKDPNYGTTKHSITSTEKENGESKYSKCGLCGKGMNGDTAKDCSNDPCGLKYSYQTEDGKAWAGWGTQLKPAHEPIALARKPMKLSIAKNCQAHGVGALNIDATRIPYDDPAEAAADAAWRAKWSKHNVAGPVFQDRDIKQVRKQQNKPSGGKGTTATFKNFSAEERTTKDQPKAGKRTASFHNATGGGETQSGGDGSGGWEASQIGRFPSNVIGEIPLYQKYFYCPKVGRAERHIGFEDPGPMFSGSRFDVYMPTNGTTDPEKTIMAVEEKLKDKGNNHPTVKPIELMKYLIQLITPPGGVVLDPFNGSGSTGCAAVELGYEYIGCELDANYVEIATRRIEAWYQHTRDSNTYSQFFQHD